MRSISTIIVSAALMAAVTACADDSDEASSFCDARTELAGSIQDVRDVNVTDDGIDALDAALDAMIADVDALKAAESELQPEADAVATAATATQAAVDAASTDAEKATAAIDGLASVAAALDAFDAAATEDC